MSNSFLGRGWGFPVTFSGERKSVVMVEEEEDIKQSLKIIISTSPGDHPLDPYFGCEVQAALFEQMDSLALNTIRDSVEKAIIEYEPRVLLNEVSVSDSEIEEGRLLIKIDYTIESINVRTNMVYPYYFTEGTDL